MKQGRPTTRVVRSLRNGQITIPADFRKALGIESDSLLQLTLDQGELRIKPVEVAAPTSGSPWLAEAYDAFADVRNQLARYSGEEIDAAIDEAVTAVRSRHA